MPYLESRFTSKGGRILRGTVQHIQQVIEGGAYLFTKEGDPAPPDAVVVCTGLGTRFLGGVEDKDLYPTRGQTVVVRAPWVRFGITIADVKGKLTYVIPRRSGDVRVFASSPCAIGVHRSLALLVSTDCHWRDCGG